jgi:type IV conjugative transfer system protein TraE
MKDQQYEHSLSNLIRNNFIFIFWGACITVAVLILAFKVDSAMKYQRTILVPDHLARKVEISDDHIPLEILEDYTESITGYAFNFTPATARGRFGKLLQYFHPDDFASAKQSFYELADTVERTKLSSSFVINKPIEIDTDKKVITVSGATRLWVESKFIDTEDKVYFITYQVTKGMFQVKAIEEKVQGAAVTPGGAKNVAK